MGLLSIFGIGRKDSELVHDMRDYLNKFIVRYATENHDAMEEIAEIFANARMMLNSMTSKNAKKAMKQNRVAAHGVLNILQNYAMAEIKTVDMKDLLFGEDDEAFNLYMYINDEKLRLGYIDEKQYQENKRLGNCIRMGQRPL